MRWRLAPCVAPFLPLSLGGRQGGAPKKSSHERAHDALSRTSGLKGTALELARTPLLRRAQPSHMTLVNAGVAANRVENEGRVLLVRFVCKVHSTRGCRRGSAHLLLFPCSLI